MAQPTGASMEQTLKDKLRNLTNSSDSITSASSWIINNRSQADQIVGLWLEQVKAVQPGRRLLLVYLCNDVLQVSRKHGPDFRRAFEPVLKDALQTVYKRAEAHEKKKIRRIIDIWQDRSVFSKPFLQDLKATLDAISSPPSASSAGPSPSPSSHYSPSPPTQGNFSPSQLPPTATQHAPPPPQIPQELFSLFHQYDACRQAMRRSDNIRSFIEKQGPASYSPDPANRPRVLKAWQDMAAGIEHEMMQRRKVIQEAEKLKNQMELMLTRLETKLHEARNQQARLGPNHPPTRSISQHPISTIPAESIASSPYHSPMSSASISSGSDTMGPRINPSVARGAPASSQTVNIDPRLPKIASGNPLLKWNLTPAEIYTVEETAKNLLTFTEAQVTDAIKLLNQPQNVKSAILLVWRSLKKTIGSGTPPINEDSRSPRQPSD